MEQADIPAVGMIGQTDCYKKVVDAFVVPDQPFALVDFPDHTNIGDSAIYAGELAYFDNRVGRPPSYVCSWKTYHQDIADFCPEGPIFLHGGGNFGDIWPRFQNLRIDILKIYGHRRIVQLPQSIHYRNIAAQDEMARAIEAAQDFTLLVRDRPSLELAQKHFDCETILCPDGACNLRRLKPSGPAHHSFLSVMRQDRESDSEAIAEIVRAAGPVIDWPDRGRWRRPLVSRLIDRAVAPHLPATQQMMRWRERFYRAHAERLIAEGVKLLSQGELIISDRLHAHILSSLMGKTHITLDNFYGKVANYIEVWGDDGLAIPVGTDSPERLKAEIARLSALSEITHD